MNITLSTQPKIREVQIRALQWAKRKKYPEEYKKSLENSNRDAIGQVVSLL